MKNPYPYSRVFLRSGTLFFWLLTLFLSVLFLNCSNGPGGKMHVDITVADHHALENGRPTMITAHTRNYNGKFKYFFSCEVGLF